MVFNPFLILPQNFSSRFNRATSFPGFLNSSLLEPFFFPFSFFFLFSFSFSIDLRSLRSRLLLRIRASLAREFVKSLDIYLSTVSKDPWPFADILPSILKTMQNAWKSTVNYCLFDTKLSWKLGSSGFGTDISYSRYLCTWRNLWNLSCSKSPIESLGGKCVRGR